MPSPGEEKKAEPGPRRSRTSISVDRDVGEEFSRQAGLTGKPLYVFANDWLAAASKISSQGGTAGKTEAEWEIFSLFKDVEAIPLPAEFVEKVVEDLCETDKERALKTFRTLGDSLVTVLRIYAPRVDQLKDLAKAFSGMAPLKRLDIEPVSGGSLMVSVVGAGRKYEVTECAFEFLRAILAGYGYAVTAYELGVGTIRLEAERQDKAMKRKPVPVSA